MKSKQLTAYSIFSSFPLVWSGVFTLAFTLTSCDSKPAASQATAGSPSSASLQTATKGTPPNIDGQKTKELFGLLKSSRTPQPNGGISGSEQSIFMHPSINGPTVATFDVSKLSGNKTIEGWIAPLPPGLGAEAGTVEVQVQLDGRSLGNFPVTRDKNMRLVADFTGKSELTLTVDCANGSDGCDWFNFGLVNP